MIGGMKIMSRSIAVMLFGPPGAGKGMQADMLVEEFGFSHLDTGRQLERIVHDPNRQSDPVIQQERQLFDSGQLNSPGWVKQMVMERVEEIASHGSGVVFSGSPRTVFEAEGLIPLLERLYGEENLRVFVIKVRPETSIFRNFRRRVCDHGHSLIWSIENDALTNCPKCGAPLRRRTLDTEDAIRVRLINYEKRTKPVLEFMRERRVRIQEIDGEPEPKVVHQEIVKALGV